MAANSRTASATQILCVLAYSKTPSLTAPGIAKSLRTNPVVVRRMLKELERAGLVLLRPGRNGGVVLTRAPEQISLSDIHHAVEDAGGPFALRKTVNPRCPVSASMTRLLGPAFGAASKAVDASLRKTNLRTLVQAIG